MFERHQKLFSIFKVAKKLASLATSPPSLPLLATSSPTLPPATVEQLEVWKMLQEEERRVQEEEMVLREQELQEQHLLWQQQRMQELQDTWKGQISTPEADLKTNMDTNKVELVFMSELPSGNEVVDAQQREQHLQQQQLQQQQQQQREDEEVERLQSELHAQLLAQVI